MDEATKTTLLEQFRAYLDATAEAVEPSSDDGQLAGSAPSPDLFTLLAEVAALKSEVKLESRKFKTALDQFRALFDTLRETNARQSQEHERVREQDLATERASSRDLLLELLDLRDRMTGGQALAERHRPGWFGSKKKTKRLVATLAEGMGMNVRRLDEILRRRGVCPLPALGQPFNPHTMHATELARDSRHPTGEVVRELRPGWLLNDDLLRAAEVVVNRIDSPVTKEAPE